MPDPGEGRVAFVLLAAGNASRMGAAKQLLEFHGQPLVRHAALSAIGSECSPVVVVLGAREAEIRPVLADLPVEVVVNTQWALGIGTSIHAGLGALAGRATVRGVVLGLADQPFVTSAFMHTLAAGLGKGGASIVASAYAGTLGVPVAFARAVFPELMSLAPDQGCKRVIMSRLDRTSSIDCPDAAIDLDSPQDYRRHVAAVAEPA